VKLSLRLALLTFLSSAVCWLPIIIFPRLDIPWLLAFSSIAVSAFLAGVLDPDHWVLFVLSSFVGSLLGQCSGYALWWPKDGIEASWVPIAVIVTIALIACAASGAAFLGAKVSASAKSLRGLAWAILVLVAAFWTAALVATPALAARRMARNERFAEERLTSLQRAAQATISNPSTSAQLCEGAALRRNYAGRTFSEEDWKRITGNYVLQDGYMFMVYCQEKAGFTIHAVPKRGGQDGTRDFCTDQSGRVGCGMESNAWHNKCLPCPR